MINCETNLKLVYQLKTLTTQIPKVIIHYLILCRHPPMYIPQEYRSLLTKPLRRVEWEMTTPPWWVRSLFNYSNLWNNPNSQEGYPEQNANVTKQIKYSYRSNSGRGVENTYNTWNSDKVGDDGYVQTVTENTSTKMQVKGYWELRKVVDLVT